MLHLKVAAFSFLRPPSGRSATLGQLPFPHFRRVPRQGPQRHRRGRPRRSAVDRRLPAARHGAPPEGLRPRRAHEDREGRGEDHRRRPPRSDPRQPHLPLGAEPRLGQLGARHVVRAPRRRPPRGQGPGARDPAASRSRRPRRRGQVRPGRRPQHPRARQRAGDRGTRRRRRRGSALPRRAGRRDQRARRLHCGRRVASPRATSTGTPSRRRRCAAPTPRPSSP